MRSIISAIILLFMVICLNAGTYSTTFAGSDENPISEGGHWINGKTTGLDWSDCAITNHMAYGVQTNGYLGNVFNDPTAILTGTWGPTQSVSGTVYIDYSLINTNKYREIELRLRSSISTNVNTGYELDYAVSVGDGEIYVFIARWNGPYGDFTDLSGGGVHGGQYRLKTGDVISGTITNTSANSATIRAYINGQLVLTGVDNNCFNSGSPGIGFDVDMQGDFAELRYYGFTSFTATDFAHSNSIVSVGMGSSQRLNIGRITLP